MAPPAGIRTDPGQAGIHPGRRGLLRKGHGHPLFDGRHSRGLRPHALADLVRTGIVPRDERQDARQRTGQVPVDALFLSLDDETLDLRGPSHPREPGKQTPDDRARQGQVHLRLSVPQDPRVVPAHEGRTAGDDGRAYRSGPPVPVRQAQHDVLLRPGRPGMGGRVRERQAGGLPRSRDGPARNRGEPLHPARHADLHLRP